MKRILLDSGILSDYVNRRRGIPEKLRSQAQLGIRIGTCIPVLAEIVAGIEASASRDRNMVALVAALQTISVWPFDQSCAFRYGHIFAELRRKGRPMQIIDMMVASVALTIGNCKIVTTDSDLLAVDGLDVEVW